LEIGAHLSQPAGGDINEDAVGWSDRAAWVIDGATGLGFASLSDDESDARWLARRLSQSFARHADDLACPLVEVLRHAVAEARAELLARCATLPEPYLAPSACAAIARLAGDRLEYAVLGDCTLLVPTADGLCALRDGRVAELERPILAHLAALRQSGVTERNALRAEIFPRVVAMRSRINRADGYWALGLDPDAATHAISGTLQPRPGAPLLLASDGLTRLFDLFGACTVEQFYAAALAEGLPALLDRLRALEHADAEGERCARIKSSDDASGLLARIV
jgi:hypothetical protein